MTTPIPTSDSPNPIDKTKSGFALFPAEDADDLGAGAGNPVQQAFDDVEDAMRPLESSEAAAQAGTDSETANKTRMTPRRTKQAIDALAAAAVPHIPIIDHELGTFTYPSSGNPNSLSHGQLVFVNQNVPASREIFIRPASGADEYIGFHWAIGFEFNVGNSRLRITAGTLPPRQLDNGTYRGHYDIVSGSLPAQGATGIVVRVPGDVPAEEDLATVAKTGAYSDLSGTPSRAGAFTAADETKLDGIEVGAQKNWLRIARFAAEDGNTNDAIPDGVIGIYQDATQIQASDISAADTFYLPLEAAAFGTDAADVNTDLDAYDVRPFGEGLLANPGSSAIIALSPYGSSEQVWFQCEQAAAHGSSGWKLSEGKHLKGSYTPASEGIGWNVVVAISHGVAVDDIIDAAGKLVFQTELAGHEDDRFSSYNNGFIANAYRAGAWVLTSDTAGAPTTDNEIRQPDIASGSGTVCFGRFRTDADPDDLQWDVPIAAAPYTNGKKFYASIDGDKSAHLLITLTADAVKVEGADDDGDYVYARADWVETGDIASVQEYGDYFRIGHEVPSKLKVELPWTDILGAPWVKPSGTRYKAETLPPTADYILADGAVISAEEAKNHDQGDNEEVTLRGDFRVNATNVTHYVTFTEPGGGLPNILKIRIPKTSDPTDDNGLDKTDLERLLQNGAWAEIDDYLLDITSNATVATIGTSVTFTANYTVLSGTKPTGSDTRKVRVVGEDVHRGELARQSFKQETPSVAGKGGAAGRVWGWVSSATDAGWRRLLDLLKADADTAAKKADYQAALATGRLQKSVAGNSNVALTAAEAAHDSVEFTGALTGDVIVTLPAAPSGPRLLRNQTTGAFALKVKAAEQADSAAITLASGNNIVLHDGASLALMGQKRRWVNSDVGSAAEAIAQNLHDDDWVDVFIEGTESAQSNELVHGLSVRFGDLDSSERIPVGVAGYNQAFVIARSGTTLNGNRGGGLSGVSTVVYAERRTYNTVALS